MSATLPTDRYELQDRLGAGGMAKVFRAFDHALSRTVAVKMLHDDLVSNEELRQRFLREARVFARLRHPHIIEIHDVVHGEQSAAMVMEFIDGTDLSHVAKRQPLRVPELAVAVLRPVMDALSHAHAEGVIHRDVKPANIMLSRDGRVKLGDFGIAKVLEETHLTHTGEFLGTPAYIAPEQARGETVTAAVDQYALGVVLYELLAGRPPYTGPTPLAVLSQILIGKFPDIRELNEAVDERLAAVLHRTLNADPAARFPDVAALMAALDALVAPISGTRERQLVAGLVADPVSTVASAALAAAEECLTTARRALAQGDVSQARTSARQALTRTPDNAEAKEMLDTLRQSVGQLVALPSAAPATTLTGITPPPAQSRLKLGLGAAGVALLTAAGLSTLFREPPPRTEPPVVTAAVEPAPRAPLATEPPRPLPSSAPATAAAPHSAEPATPAEPERRPARPADTTPREKPLPVQPAAAAEAPVTAAPASVAPRVGHLRLVTQPWADVEIDGQRVGRTPYLPDAELSAGPHRLVLRNPGLPVHEETIRIEAGQTLQRRVNLMPAGSAP
jgi:tRNA A-37 threonylcarbamoyl transferase component Bud32